LILASTFERIRLPADIMGYFVGRSIWARQGLLVITATAVMPGSIGYLTLELNNLGENAIHLQEGMSIGELYLQTVPASPELTLLGLAVSSSEPRVTVYSYTPLALFDPQETRAAAHLYTEAWTRNYEEELRLGALNELEALIADPRVKESNLQHFFEEHPWIILGDKHIEVRAQLVLERADGQRLRPDFFLKPIEGDLWDILDIKRPFRHVVVGTRDRRRLSAEVRDGVAQLREYARYFDDGANRETLRRRYGIISYRPKLILLVGRSFDIGDPIRERDIRGEASQVELMSYDELLRVIGFRLSKDGK
jgi:dCTP deaminase-like/Shedu protein SduA, C-terminal